MICVVCKAYDKLLPVGLLAAHSCKNVITSKYLQVGKEDAGAADRVIPFLLSIHLLRLSLRFLNVLCRNITVTNETD